MNEKVRVRFAPSPTGPLHIGGVRTALFNYIFAKKHGGEFILRIEDTDQNRFVEGAEQYIIEALNWCNIPFDEGPGKEGECGPYRQSERKHIYKEYAQTLIEAGHAYYAFDSPEKLDEARKAQESEGKTFIYNWHNRLKLDNSLSLDSKTVQEKLRANEEFVIRFKSPKNEILHLKDMIRGDIEIDTNILDDKILFKSDGMPTYHLANIVDDHLMKITHVIRGEEWLPSLSLHYQLYNAFGWSVPQFAHLPLLLKPTGKGKLSKRDGDKLGFPVFPLEWKNKSEETVSSGYREEGYFPDALINFLAFLGWNPGTEQEIFNLDQLIEEFSLERVHKSGARFDPEKIKWYNHQYMQRQPNLDLAAKFIKLHSELSEKDPDYVALAVNMIKERATFVSDFWRLSHYFFIAPSEYEDKAFKKAIKEDTKELLLHLIEIVVPITDFSVNKLEEAIKSWITSNNIGFGKVMMPLRLALVGELQGPDVFEIMFMIGKNESTERIRALVESI